MATDVRETAQPNAPHDNGPSVTSLVTGIVNDTQELIKKHLELFRTEVKEDFTKTKQALIPLIVGVVVMGVGALLICFTLVNLIYWAAFPHLELWVCDAIVAGTFVLVGGILVYAGKKRFDTFNPLPDKTIKEIQWTIKPK